jgi:predicted acyltransferase
MDSTSGYIPVEAVVISDLPTRDSESDFGCQRMLSLDVMRGFTMALMLMVDVCGDTVPFFSHASWSGLHLADFVMPCFLFIVGASLGVSLPRSLARSDRCEILTSALVRSCKLFALGLIVQGSWMPATDGSKDIVGFDLEQVRIMGILQRISVCYFLLVVIVVCIPAEVTQAIVVGSLLILQLSVPTFVKVPGCDETGQYSMECNAAAYLDRNILGSWHLYKPLLGYDPEGLVSTLGCLFTCYIGYMSVQAAWRDTKRRLFVSGCLTLLGLAISVKIPFNKSLWTHSYNFLTAGVCVFLLTGLDGLKISDVERNPIAHLGMNAIAFFLFSDCGGLLSVLLDSVWVSRDGRRVTVLSLFKDRLHIIVFASIQLVFFSACATWLYRRKRFLKI